jgi:sugar/nucleoside kinase (ribokinase family)
VKKTVVLGDLNIDMILSGMQSSPSFGREILAEGGCIKPGGSAANAAMVLAMCGTEPEFYSVLGDDVFSSLVISELHGSALSTGHIVRVPGHSTGITVSLSYPHDRMYITSPGTISTAVLEFFDKGYFEPNGHIHLTSYFLQSGLKPQVGEILEKAKEASMTTSLDPGNDPALLWDVTGLEPYYPCLDYFLPNADEMLGITGAESVEDALRLFSQKAECVIVKCGADGAIMRNNGSVGHFPAAPAEAVDTSCAGDCFDAGFLLYINRGSTIEMAVEMGNRFGALASASIGLPPWELLRKEIDR